MNQNTTLTPFRIDIPQADLDDLHERLDRARWPIDAPGRDDPTGFGRGIPLLYLQELAAHWRGGFDWRGQEARLNEHPQFTTVVEGQTFHLLHVRSTNPDATPLLLNHGWPGSFVEYQHLIPLLTADFHIVVVTPPGFGFSTPLSRTGWELARTTDAYAEIMSRLGYERFLAHGTDMGAGVTGRLAALSPERIIGTHVGGDRTWLGLVGTRFPAPDDLTDEESVQLTAAHVDAAAELGYLAMQNHRPDTIGPALTDSPVALLAWIAEKFKQRVDGGHRPPAVDRDQLLTIISVYWFTRSGASSAQFYYESEHAPLSLAFAPGVPAGWAVFDAHPLVRRTMDPWNTVAHWNEYADGGHFPAMEEPALLADDIRAFARGLA